MRLLIISLFALLSPLSYAASQTNEWTDNGYGIVDNGNVENDILDFDIAQSNSNADAFGVSTHVSDTTQTTIPTDSLLHMAQRNERLERRIAMYENRLARRQRMWNAIIPTTARLQFFGSTGLVNAGLGWKYGKRHQWETDFMFGFVPKYDKDKAFGTFTLRQTYIPFTNLLSGHRPEDTDYFSKPYFTFQPLAVGVYANTVLSGDYWGNEPKKYPEGYYWFATKVRFHIFVGQRYTVHIPHHHRYMGKSASLFWELSTADLYFITKVVNKSIPFKDILSLSFGLKMDI